MTLSEQIGEIISSNNRDAKVKLEELLNLTSGHELFQGKITDVIRETKGGFNLGEMNLEGIEGNKDEQMKVYFQNENLLAEKNGQVIAMTPDLICLVDYETLLPVTTESLKYGNAYASLACQHIPNGERKKESKR